MKACSKCGCVLPLSSFHKRTASPDGLAYKCKGCESADNRAWRECHRDRKAAADREYYLAHKDQAAAAGRRYYQRRKQKPGESEKMRAQVRASYQRHREMRLVRIRAWREEHRDYWQLWSQRNQESRRASSHRRRARLAACGDNFTKDDVVAQRKRQHGRCYYCGTRLKRGHHVDHVIPLCLGGGNGPGNIVLSCPTCNLSKGARLPHESTGRLC